MSTPRALSLSSRHSAPLTTRFGPMERKTLVQSEVMLDASVDKSGETKMSYDNKMTTECGKCEWPASNKK